MEEPVEEIEETAPTIERKARTRHMSDKAKEALALAREKAYAVRKQNAEKRAMEKNKLITKKIKEVALKPTEEEQMANIAKELVVKTKEEPEVKTQRKKEVIKQAIMETREPQEVRIKRKKEILKEVLQEELGGLRQEVQELRQFKNEVSKIKERSAREIQEEIFEKQYQDRLNKYRLNMIRRGL